MKIVPFGPCTMVRAPGCPLDQTSALKPGGSLILSTGSLSAAAGVGGVGCGLRLVSWFCEPGFDLSSELKPGGVCAIADAANRLATVPASKARTTEFLVIRFLPAGSLSRVPNPWDGCFLNP